MSRRDPKPRQDGRCASCEQPVEGRARDEGDPFCSVECCRAYHGCPMPIFGHGLNHTGRQRRDAAA